MSDIHQNKLTKGNYRIRKTSLNFKTTPSLWQDFNLHHNAFFCCINNKKTLAVCWCFSEITFLLAFILILKNNVNHYQNAVKTIDNVSNKRFKSTFTNTFQEFCFLFSISLKSLISWTHGNTPLPWNWHLLIVLLSFPIVWYQNNMSTKRGKAQNKPEISDYLVVCVLNLLPKVSTLLNLVAVNPVKVEI